MTSQTCCWQNTKIATIEMDGAGSKIYWIGTTIPFASIIYQNDYLTFRWETNRESILDIYGLCFTRPDVPIADMDEMKGLTGNQLKNLIFNCRIVIQQ